MKSICFFSSFFNTPAIPYYVQYYLIELKKHFSEIIFITNEKQLSPDAEQFLSNANIELMKVKNEGFDFGMWYKAFQSYDVSTYDRVGLINDSSILFRNLDDFFDWTVREPLDYCGIIDCNLHSYHVQSYFVIINKRAIPLVKDYFGKNGIITDFKQVIMVYEIGLSAYMVKAGMNVKGYFSFKEANVGNPSWMKAKELIRNGFPLVKKKIIARNYGESDYKGIVAAGFDPYPSHYFKLIKKVIGRDETNKIFAGITQSKGFWGEIKFHTICIIARIYGASRRSYRKMKPRKR